VTRKHCKKGRRGFVFGRAKNYREKKYCDASIAKKPNPGPENFDLGQRLGEAGEGLHWRGNWPDKVKFVGSSQVTGVLLQHSLDKNGRGVPFPPIPNLCPPVTPLRRKGRSKKTPDPSSDRCEGWGSLLVAPLCLHVSSFLKWFAYTAGEKKKECREIGLC